MNEPTLYQIDTDAPITEDTLIAVDRHSGGQRALVPVERCEHGNTGRHIIEGTIVETYRTGDGPTERIGFSYQTCAGIGGDE